MNCKNCKHYCFANGSYWCDLGPHWPVTINPHLSYSDPCSFFEEVTKVETTTSTQLTSIERLKQISTPAEENWLEIEKQWEKEDTNDIVVKASRLAESVLMDWSKEEQIELAKEVAIMTHKILIENE